MRIDLTIEEIETVWWALRDGIVYKEHQKVAVHGLCKRAISDYLALQDKFEKYIEEYERSKTNAD